MPGPLLYELALSITSYGTFRDVYEESASRLATAVNGIGFFFLRSGKDMVCAARYAKIDALTVQTGMRRPMAGSAGGIAMLLLIPKLERDAIVSENFEYIRKYGGASIAALTRMLRRSEKLGFGINESETVPQWNTLGLGISDPSGGPFGSLMIAATPDRLQFDRLDYWIGLLRDEVRQLEVAAMEHGVWH